MFPSIIQPLRLAIAIVLAASPPNPELADPPVGDPVRGVTITTATWGHEWGTESIDRTIDELAKLGVTWVSIHPYASIRNDGSIRWRAIDPEDPPTWLTRPIEQAHAKGLKILVKPHIGYWGSRFDWRGAIEFEDEAAWQRFFADYARWIEQVAQATATADAFAVGTELDRTLGHEQEWRQIIAKLREVSAAPLTYAANWTDYQKVPFWDALDVIGVQAYFPLTESATSDPATLAASWKARMAELRRFAETRDQYIVFTELGYSRSHEAPVQPWVDDVDDASALETQHNCLESALLAIQAEPRVIGSFLWKWFPEAKGRDHDFKLQDPAITKLIRSTWVEAR